MTGEQGELERRAKIALEAIKASLDVDAGEPEASLFVSHHLDELDQAYWQTQLKTDRPEPAQVLSLLRLRSHWSDEDDDGLDTLDFSLPGSVSDYVLSVRFDENGAVEEISMES